METATIPAGFRDLPTEILEVILQGFRPNPLQPFDFQQFRHALQQLSQLRLITKACYNILTPLLYSSVVLPMYHEKAFLNSIQAVRYHPELIHAVYLQGEWHRDEHFQRVTINLLRPFLSACLNLRELHIDGGETIFWNMSRGRIQRLFEVIPASLTTISLNYVTYGQSRTTGCHMISSMLIGMGRPFAERLKSLEIGNGFDGYNQSDDLALPRYFPSLERLVLRDLHIQKAARILSRVTCDTKHPERPQCGRRIRYQRNIPFHDPPLHDLTLTVLLRSPQDVNESILDLFKINNIASRITSLRLGIGYPSFIVDFEVIPQTIIQLCPNLRIFFYRAPCPLTFLETPLPSSLRELGIRVVRSRETGQTRFVHDLKPIRIFVEDSRCRMGVTKLYVKSTTYLDLPPLEGMEELREACRVHGVQFFDKFAI
ncbi:hypothetical protein BDN72DRAFT_895592 [Pluteus cervinus]|uniref:Uncharacterized protein n=1 Tax=Pluteus cervinus TaxID=181527 RepID=A0ACD3B1J9_9AGAR|nr:hypothetical protein BDN72DRAFT_895592 [Pluteus cervinus]